MQPNLSQIASAELPKNNDQLAFSIFVSRSGRRVKHDLHCIACGLTFTTITYTPVSMVDNPGPADKQEYIEIQCKRCKQMYRVYVI
jgi:hypothetical protein